MIREITACHVNLCTNHLMITGRAGYTGKHDDRGDF